MRTTRGRSAGLAVVLAVFALGLSAETCQNSTSTSTPAGATVTITDRFSVVTVEPNVARGAIATCEAGEVMLSGGYSMDTPAYDGSLATSGFSDDYNRYYVYADYPASPTSWTAAVVNGAEGTEAGDLLLVVHVECASGLSGTPSIVVSNVADTSHLISASCTGGALTGGGYQLANPPTIDQFPYVHSNNGPPIFQSYTPDQDVATNVWHVVSDASVSHYKLLAYAVCNSALLVGARGTSGTASAPAIDAYQTTSGTAQASCGAGQILTGAGFVIAGGRQGSGQTLAVTRILPENNVTPPQWTMTLYSVPHSIFGNPQPNLGGTAYIVPVCARAAGLKSAGTPLSHPSIP